MLGPLNHTTDIITSDLCTRPLLKFYTSQVHGVISSDEPINGISPNLGTETCDVSDMTYSAQHMLRVTGRGVYADRIERAALNAGPGAVRGEESVLPTTLYCTRRRLY